MNISIFDYFFFFYISIHLDSNMSNILPILYAQKLLNATEAIHILFPKTYMKKKTLFDPLFTRKKAKRNIHSSHSYR